jgi:hypothetical protein
LITFGNPRSFEKLRSAVDNIFSAGGRGRGGVDPESRKEKKRKEALEYHGQM